MMRVDPDHCVDKLVRCNLLPPMRSHWWDDHHVAGPYLASNTSLDRVTVKSRSDLRIDWRLWFHIRERAARDECCVAGKDLVNLSNISVLLEPSAILASGRFRPIKNRDANSIFTLVDPEDTKHSHIRT